MRPALVIARRATVVFRSFAPIGLSSKLSSAPTTESSQICRRISSPLPIFSRKRVCICRPVPSPHGLDLLRRSGVAGIIPCRSLCARYCASGSLGPSGVHFAVVLFSHTLSGLSLTQVLAEVPSRRSPTPGRRLHARPLRHSLCMSPFSATLAPRRGARML